MKIEEVAMALIDAFTGGGASLWGRQIACSPSMIAQYGYQLKGVGEEVTKKSSAYGFTCTTSIQPNHTGQAGTSAVASYTQQSNAMEMISSGLQSLADKVKGVSEFLQKAQTYLKNLLETFRAKIISLLGSWVGTLVVAAVAMLAVKLIKLLINKVASRLGAAGAVLRAVGDKLANEVQASLTKPNSPPQPPTAQPKGNGPTWVAKPVPHSAPAKPMPNVFDNSPF